MAPEKDLRIPTTPKALIRAILRKPKPEPEPKISIVTICGDASEALAFIDRLESINSPLDLPQFPEELIRLYVDHCATDTCELLVRFQPSDTLQRLVAAVTRDADPFSI